MQFKQYTTVLHFWIDHEKADLQYLHKLWLRVNEDTVCICNIKIESSYSTYDKIGKFILALQPLSKKGDKSSRNSDKAFKRLITYLIT